MLKYSIAFDVPLIAVLSFASYASAAIEVVESSARLAVISRPVGSSAN